TVTNEELLKLALCCNRCGTCRGVVQDSVPDVAFSLQCPSGMTFFGSYEPSGLMYLARGIAQDVLSWNEDLARVLFSCTMCGYCDDFCQRGYRHTPALTILEELRRRVPDSFKPKALQKAAESIVVPKDHCLGILEEYGIVDISDGRGPETIFFPDPTILQNPSKLREIGFLFKKSGMNVGCCIKRPLPPVSATLINGGFRELLEECGREIDNRLRQMGIQQVVVYHPETLSVLKRFSRSGASFISLTRFCADLMKKKRPKKLKLPAVTYQDPCHLGRYSKEYAAPREIIQMLGLTLKEMWRAGKNALCCGAGGGVLTGNPTLAKKYAATRWHEAVATGARIMITACPFCFANMNGTKPKAFKVMDITALVAQAYGYTGKEVTK
ncbi:MAG: (Fe-S)-binding protein, partial [Desulfobacterota bacterium]|nr:(Fe-S)-binding protein [Thermodesulfobacteriota bacterium]